MFWTLLYSALLSFRTVPLGLCRSPYTATYLTPGIEHSHLRKQRRSQKREMICLRRGYSRRHGFQVLRFDFRPSLTKRVASHELSYNMKDFPEL